VITFFIILISSIIFSIRLPLLISFYFFQLLVFLHLLQIFIFLLLAFMLIPSFSFLHLQIVNFLSFFSFVLFLIFFRCLILFFLIFLILIFLNIPLSFSIFTFLSLSLLKFSWNFTIRVEIFLRDLLIRKWLVIIYPLEINILNILLNLRFL